MKLISCLRVPEQSEEFQRLRCFVDLGLQEVNSAGVILSSFNHYPRAACLHLVRAADILEELERQHLRSEESKTDRAEETVRIARIRRRAERPIRDLWKKFFPEMRRIAREQPYEQAVYSQGFEEALRRIHQAFEDIYCEVARELNRIYQPFALRWFPLAALFVLFLVVGGIVWRYMGSARLNLLNSGLLSSAVMLKEVEAGALSQTKEAGTAWDMVGNVLIPAGKQGLLVHFGASQHAGSIEVSLDNNDNYQIYFLREGETLGDVFVPSNPLDAGLQIYAVDIPQAVARKGFDQLRIVGREGDDSYSIGHLRLH